MILFLSFGKEAKVNNVFTICGDNRFLSIENN